MTEPISPNECPTRELHADGPFRYCPNCSWTEADDAPPCRSEVLWHRSEVLHDTIRARFICEDYLGHHGDHSFTLKACEPIAKLTWAAQEGAQDG